LSASPNCKPSREEKTGPALYIPASSLYVHIPFCKSKCDYCDFFSLPLDTAEIPARYLDAALAEIACHREKGCLAPLKTLYIGGGTPSLFSAAQISRLVSGIAGIVPFEPDCEITLEANPDDIAPPYLDGLRQAEIRRLSLGIQSLSKNALCSVHRRSNAERCLEALDCVRENWPGRLSCDLIAGVPGETPASFLKGLKTLAGYGPEHISLYAITVTEGTSLYRKVKAGLVPNPEELAETLWLAGRDYLEQEGWRQYEVSNFAKPGAECRHNLTYWQSESYIGAGSGAAGTLYRRDGSAFRYTNTTDVSGYLEQQTNREIEEISRETAQFEYLMMGFRTRHGVSSKRFFERFGVPLEKRIGAESGAFAAWEKQGLAAQHNEAAAETRYALTAEGLLFLNRFLEELMD
jgi:oxygen-independent coproporphyrinogen-3 oxidase